MESESAPQSLPEKVWDICRQNKRPQLDALAQRLEPKMTWDDLVLPRVEMKLLRGIAAQVRQRNKVYDDWGFARKMNRGFGISALFAGDSGCGKTMAAEVIANELRLNLYRIDLSAVVNKYIGETEKNLRRLFDAAEEGGSILFFDEADALFGKRSEVKDSHDRYANIEINYLLQRLESYRGLAILATNMKSGLDTAFLRRLRFVVNFPFPGITDRRRLWEKVFLQEEVARNLPCPPLETLDYERLARLNLTGGHIHNVALNACFTAAGSESQKVTMPLVLEAARAEFMKLDRPVNETDFYYAERASTEPKPVARNGEAALV
jgi:SpoVK/Ycf46/Vps4 family AAA+-type ATPase